MGRFRPYAKKSGSCGSPGTWPHLRFGLNSNVPTRECQPEEAPSLPDRESSNGETVQRSKTGRPGLVDSSRNLRQPDVTPTVTIGPSAVASLKSRDSLEHPAWDGRWTRTSRERSRRPPDRDACRWPTPAQTCEVAAGVQRERPEVWAHRGGSDIALDAEKRAFAAGISQPAATPRPYLASENGPSV